MKSKIIICAIGLMTLVAMGCKDPREKTVWDYIGHQSANQTDWENGIESLHRDLIKHGYMADHNCYEMKCYDNHQNTYADIDRINSLLGFKAANNDQEIEYADTVEYTIGYDSMP
ncbi:MAG: hypothetical protein ACSW8I_08635 [bacterium]